MLDVRGHAHVVMVHPMATHQIESKPPPLLTEPELLKEMARKGIGTDATASSHIETIQTRG